MKEVIAFGRPWHFKIVEDVRNGVITVAEAEQIVDEQERALKFLQQQIKKRIRDERAAEAE
jgi:hypothetical protein